MYRLEKNWTFIWALVVLKKYAVENMWKGRFDYERKTMQTKTAIKSTCDFEQSVVFLPSYIEPILRQLYLHFTSIKMYSVECRGQLEIKLEHGLSNECKNKNNNTKKNSFSNQWYLCARTKSCLVYKMNGYDEFSYFVYRMQEK